MTNPNEPTLSCSEVVERLRAKIEEKLRGYMTKKMANIVAYDLAPWLLNDPGLHEWREHRVQELEELLLRMIDGELGDQPSVEEVRAIVQKGCK